MDKMISSTQEGLCIIGDEDPCYIPERFEKLNGKENMQTLLIPGTEHSLNYRERPIDSIDVLKKVITRNQQFLMESGRNIIRLEKYIKKIADSDFKEAKTPCTSRMFPYLIV